MALAALAIGIAVGATGIGGFLLIPVLWWALDVPLRHAMGTTLIASAANGLLATVLFARRGSMPWAIAAPLSAGGVVCAFAGGVLTAMLPALVLAKLLGAVIAIGSAYALVKRAPDAGALPSRPALLFVIGLISGLIAGLTGAGGPLISVPLMTLAGFPYLATVASSQALQLVASAAGGAAYWLDGAVLGQALLIVIPAELAGIWAGVRLAHRLDVATARRVLAILGVVIGVGLLVF